jgi:hypothetical protein
VTALTAVEGWEIHQYDVVAAYLLAQPRKIMYAYYPPGSRKFLQYNSTDGTVLFELSQHLLRVRKNVFGEEAAGAIWYDMLSLFFMHDLECLHSTIDRCVFVRTAFRDEVGMTGIILLYVNDVLFVGDSVLATELSIKFTEHFPTNRGGDAYLGYEIKVDNTASTVRATQKALAQKAIGKYGFADFTATHKPFAKSWTVISASKPAGSAPTNIVDFRSALGAIGWLTATRPDVRFAYGVLTSIVSLSVNSPTDRR